MKLQEEAHLESHESEEGGKRARKRVCLGTIPSVRKTIINSCPEFKLLCLDNRQPGCSLQMFLPCFSPGYGNVHADEVDTEK